MDEDYTIYCSRCGAPMKSSARYCMKCGNLNYDHPDNQKMKEFAPLENKKYEVGSGKIETGTSFKANVSESATNTGNKKMFLIVNSLWFLLTYGLGLLLGALKVADFGAIFYIFIVLSILNIYVVSLEVINMKANRPWWSAIIPIYNVCVLTDIVFEKMIYVVLYFIPIVNFFFILAVFFQLGKKFNKNPFLTMLFNIFMLPVIAFGVSNYNGVNYTDLTDEHAIEKEFKLRKRLLYVIIIFLVVGVGGFGYSLFTSGNSILNNAEDKLFVENARAVVNRVKSGVQKGKFECSGETSLLPNSVHYFVFGDISSDLNILTFDDKAVKAYVKVFNNNGVIGYSISMSDGEKGFNEIREEELSIDKINFDYKSVGRVDLKKSCYLD